MPSSQADLLKILDAAIVPKTAPSPSKGANSRKRTLTLLNGNAVDIGRKLTTASPDIVEAMRQRIIQLEDELSAQSNENGPPAKRARKSNAKPKDDDGDYAPEASTSGPSASSKAAPSTAAQAKADKAMEKKLKARLKKLFDALKKELRSPTCKFQGRGPKTLKVDEILEPDEFDQVFGNKGRLIQPTPTNKPGSTVTIIIYAGDSINELFGDELKPLKGDVWNIGGAPFFTKSKKLGTCEVEIISIEVSYSKNTSKASIKFEVDQIGGGRDYGMDDWW
ncbi:hypothetical protein DL93DRAFT_2076164 [Clavulina sp. PMI_390]|nr:hypothetical protein DL93DRAFT_2076164 [Clavulina sp. PMI_390]